MSWLAAGDEPLLVRNYDYDKDAFDAIVMKSRWNGRGVIGTTDGLFCLVDGLNDAGLAASLTFGGRREVGEGFGVPLILRYILQTCSTAAEAGEVLQRVPCHMSYNVTVLDVDRRFLTAYLSPDRPTVLTHAAVATNHQERVEWSSIGLAWDGPSTLIYRSSGARFHLRVPPRPADRRCRRRPGPSRPGTGR